MPRIPDFVPRVAQDPGRMVAVQAPGVQPMQNFAPQQLQQASEAVSRIGQVGVDYQMRVQDDIDSAMVKQHDNMFADAIEEALRDPKGGFLNLVGGDAVKARKAAIEAVESQSKKIGQGLETAMQRQIWGDLSNQRLRRARADIDNHYTKESKVFEVGQSEARVAVSRRDMLNTVSDPAAFEQARATMLSEVDKIAARMGDDPESRVRNEMRLQATTDAYSLIVRSLQAEGKIDKADEKLNEGIAKGDIDPEVATKLRASIGDSTDDAEALRLAMRTETGNAPFLVQRDEIDRLFKEDKITERVHQKALAHAQQRASQKYSERNVAANTIVRDTAQFAQTNRKEVTSYDMLPQWQRESLEETDKSTGSDTVGAMKLFFERGGQWVTTELGARGMVMPESMLLQYQSEEQIEKLWRADLDNDDLQSLVGRWQRLRGIVAERSTKGGIDDGEVTEELWTLFDNNTKWTLPSDSASEKENKELWRKRMTIEVKQKAASEANGKPLTRQHIRDAFYKAYAEMFVTEGSSEPRPLSSMNAPEKEAAWQKPSGGGMEQVFFKSMTADVREAMKRRINTYNDSVRRWNSGDFSTKPFMLKQLRDPDSMSAIINEYADQRWRAEQDAEKERERARQAELVREAIHGGPGGRSGRFRDSSRGR